MTKQRALKFRVYDRFNKVWYRYQKTIHECWETFSKDPETYHIVQYTGLKDKNGEEIYEGDILEHTYPAGYSLYEVCFGSYDNNLEYEDHESGHGVYLKEIYELCQEKETKSNQQYNPLGFPCADQLKIVGDIYKNPELLEK